MLVRATGYLTDDLCLLTLGNSCHYLAGYSRSSAASGTPLLLLFDCCLSVQFPLLLQRLAHIGVQPRDIAGVALTHLHVDRIGALPLLRRLNPDLKVYGSPQLKTLLGNASIIKRIYDEDLLLSNAYTTLETPERPALDEYSELLQVTDTVRGGDSMQIDQDCSARVVSLPGHTAESLAYFLQPNHFLIADEVLGYYRPGQLAGPAGDHSLDLLKVSLQQVQRLEVAGLGLTNHGTITGKLVSSYLQGLLQGINDLQFEALGAHGDGVSDDDIRQAIWEAFYAGEPQDHLSQHARTESFEKTWKQLLVERKLRAITEKSACGE